MTNLLKLIILLIIASIVIGFASIDVYTIIVSDKLESLEYCNSAISDAEINKITSAILSVGVWVLGCSLLLFFIVAVGCFRYFTNPLKDILQYAENLSTGNLDYTPKTVKMGGEFGELMKSLDYVRDRLQSSSQKLAKSYEREEEALREIEIANNRRNEFLANISRGLRDPLNSILGFAGIITKEIDDGAYDYKLREKTNIILQSAGRLNNLIGNLIELSRLDSDEISINEREFETSEFMSELIQYNSNDAEQKSISLNTQFTSSLPPILKSDRQLLFHVISNLLTNAIKASPFGSDVTFGVDINDEYFIFYVKDSVVENETVPLAMLYDKYVKSESELFNGIKGTTILNMTIVKALSNLLNATVEAEYDSSGSSTFKVIFSIDDIVCTDYSDDLSAKFFLDDKNDGVIELDNQFEIHKTKKLEFMLDKPISVLMAENNESNRMLVEAILDKANCELEYVDDGMSCLDVLNRRDFDVLLLDHYINKLEAHKVVEALRSNPRFENLPIIIMATYVSEDDKNTLLLTGVSDFILKPINADKLIYLVHSWYNKTH